MNHGKALLIKAMIILPVAWLMLTVFFDVSLLDATLLGLLLTFIAYSTGDMMILPKLGNLAATIGDLVLASLVLWLGLEMFGYDHHGGEALMTAVILSAGEWFYHKWLLKQTSLSQQS